MVGRLDLKIVVGLRIFVGLRVIPGLKVIASIVEERCFSGHEAEVVDLLDDVSGEVTHRQKLHGTRLICHSSGQPELIKTDLPSNVSSYSCLNVL